MGILAERSRECWDAGRGNQAHCKCAEDTDLQEMRLCCSRAGEKVHLGLVLLYASFMLINVLPATSHLTASETVYKIMNFCITFLIILRC